MSLDFGGRGAGCLLDQCSGSVFEGSNWNLDSKPDKFSVGVTFHTFFGGSWPNQCWKTPTVVS